MKQYLCVILNHNNNKNAKKLKELFSRNFITYVVDSGSSEKVPGFLHFNNIYYSGGLNEAYKKLVEEKKSILIFICSDVTIEEEEYYKMVSKFMKNEIPLDFGVYSPSTVGRAHVHCKNVGRGLRKVPFVEGFFFVARKQVLDNILPVDMNLNKLGWGLDVAKGYVSERMGLSCYVDDDIVIKHPPGTGYSSDSAIDEMKRWVRNFPDKNLVLFLQKHMRINANS